MLSAKWDVHTAKRFFKKMMVYHRRLTLTISVNKNAAYPEAFTSSQKEKVLLNDCKLRRVKHLKISIERDHRYVVKRVRACLGYCTFDMTQRMSQGVVALNMLHKRQVKRLGRSNTLGLAKFVESLFWIAA